MLVIVPISIFPINRMPQYPTLRSCIFFSSRLHKRHSNQNASEYMCESFESVFTLLEINVECRDYDL